MNVKRLIYCLCFMVVVGFLGTSCLAMLIGLYVKYGVTPIIVIAVFTASIAGLIFFHDA